MTIQEIKEYPIALIMVNDDQRREMMEWLMLWSEKYTKEEWVAVKPSKVVIQRF